MTGLEVVAATVALLLILHQNLAEIDHGKESVLRTINQGQN